MSERPLAFYPRLKNFTVAGVLTERQKDVRCIVIFGKLVIMWDAPDRGRKVNFR